MRQKRNTYRIYAMPTATTTAGGYAAAVGSTVSTATIRGAASGAARGLPC
jgi:hypothetical protein